jgi:hypothetical protein
MSGNNSVKINNLQLKLFPDSGDEFVTWSNTSNLVVLIPVSNLYNGSNNSLKAANLVLTVSNTPSNSTQNTTFGQIWTDGTYLYVGTSNNNIKRVALTSF